MLFKRQIFRDADEIEIRLPFCRSFTTSWNIFGGLCAQVFYSRAWIIGDVKSFVSQKQKLCNHNPNIETEIFKP